MLGRILRIILICLLFIPFAIYFIFKGLVLYLFALFKVKQGQSPSNHDEMAELKQAPYEQSEEDVSKRESPVQAAVSGAKNTDGPESAQSVKPTQTPSPTIFPKSIEEFMEALKRIEFRGPFEEVESPADMSIIIKFIEQKKKGKALLPPIGIVCRKWLLHFEDGHKATLSIGIAAVQFFLDMIPVSTEEDIYVIIEQGIKIGKDLHGGHQFGDIIEIINTERALAGKSMLEAVLPEKSELLDEAFLNLMKETPYEFPFVGLVKDGFENLLNMLDGMAKEHSQQVCGVITCNNQTIVVYFPKPGQPFLFDPQGRTLQGNLQGASLMRYQNVPLLAAHLQQNLFKKGHFALIMLGLKK